MKPAALPAFVRHDFQPPVSKPRIGPVHVDFDKAGKFSVAKNQPNFILQESAVETKP
jgi:hypothetical protein